MRGIYVHDVGAAVEVLAAGDAGAVTVCHVDRAHHGDDIGVGPVELLERGEGKVEHFPSSGLAECFCPI